MVLNLLNSGESRIKKLFVPKGVFLEQVQANLLHFFNVRSFKEAIERNVDCLQSNY